MKIFGPRLKAYRFLCSLISNKLLEYVNKIALSPRYILCLNISKTVITALKKSFPKAKIEILQFSDLKKSHLPSKIKAINLFIANTTITHENFDLSELLNNANRLATNEYQCIFATLDQEGKTVIAKYDREQEEDEIIDDQQALAELESIDEEEYLSFKEHLVQFKDPPAFLDCHIFVITSAELLQKSFEPSFGLDSQTFNNESTLSTESLIQLENFDALTEYNLENDANFETLEIETHDPMLCEGNRDSEDEETNSSENLNLLSENDSNDIDREKLEIETENNNLIENSNAESDDAIADANNLLWEDQADTKENKSEELNDKEDLTQNEFDTIIPEEADTLNEFNSLNDNEQNIELTESEISGNKDFEAKEIDQTDFEDIEHARPDVDTTTTDESDTTIENSLTPDLSIAEENFSGNISQDEKLIANEEIEENNSLTTEQDHEDNLILETEYESNEETTEQDKNENTTAHDSELEEIANPENNEISVEEVTDESIEQMNEHSENEEDQNNIDWLQEDEIPESDQENDALSASGDLQWDDDKNQVDDEDENLIDDIENYDQYEDQIIEKDYGVNLDDEENVDDDASNQTEIDFENEEDNDEEENKTNEDKTENSEVDITLVSVTEDDLNDKLPEQVFEDDEFDEMEDIEDISLEDGDDDNDAVTHFENDSSDTLNEKEDKEINESKNDNENEEDIFDDDEDEDENLENDENNDEEILDKVNELDNDTVSINTHENDNEISEIKEQDNEFDQDDDDDDYEDVPTNIETEENSCNNDIQNLASNDRMIIGEEKTQDLNEAVSNEIDTDDEDDDAGVDADEEDDENADGDADKGEENLKKQIFEKLPDKFNEKKYSANIFLPIRRQPVSDNHYPQKDKKITKIGSYSSHLKKLKVNDSENKSSEAGIFHKQK